ncbi:IS66 family transposase [Crateriforma conspicua]|uniref:Transposase IS66 family protein n=1 Tax=Crateriforma conspicua TaxID=2527996 RepID=A0A5C6FJY4_9PLAN|nr:transposase [Crateriforma conspicua]TWU61729.1 Transposase IS66 family protein [Crateriforma conspicua]
MDEPRFQDDSLSSDMESCHRLIASLQAQITQQASELSLQEKLVEEQAHSVLELQAASDKLQERNTELTLRVEQLLQQLFGRKSERRVNGEGQLFLDLGEEATLEVVHALEEAVLEAEQIVQDAEQEKQRRGAKRLYRDDRKFPEHLPRTEKTVDLPEEQREGSTLIGYDEVESLHCKRSELYVPVTRYAKYAYPADKTQGADQERGIVSPERPTGLVEGNRLDASIGVIVVAWKYFFHLPFYRQQDLFAGSRWTPSRSTLQNLETNVEFALRPLADWLRGYLKTDRCIGCDETGVALITPRNLPDLSGHPRRDRITEVLGEAIEKGKPSVKAHFWGYYASRLPVVAFDFTVSRHRDGPDDVLSDYEGNLVGDCWSGFQKIDVRSDSRMTFAACWAHARRKIDECRSAFPLQVAKLESLIRMLYDVEDQNKTLDDTARRSRRQSLSRHALDQIDEYLGSEAMQSASVLPKSNLGIAAADVRRHWAALNRFTEDASIPIDNNDCEQLMKRVATGRKNWLFRGSLASGERGSNLMTIIGSAIRKELDVHAYLEDVLRRALAGETDWASLAPHAWKAEHPEAIRTYDSEERRQAADRKRVRRARRRRLKK